MPPTFKTRTTEDELMDDFSIIGDRLTSALEELRVVNRFLGGYATTMAVLGPWLKAQPPRSTPIRILDLGTGIADFPEYMVRWAAAQSPAIPLEIVAVDANPVTVAYARHSLKTRLPEHLAATIHVEVADALALPYGDRSFDLAMGAMFLHHFAQENAVTLVKAMQRVSRCGLLINDLHRHPLAYYGIVSLTRILRASEMVQNDGPISVLRGFKRDDLEAIAASAGLKNPTVRWRWPFRWILTTLN